MEEIRIRESVLPAMHPDAGHEFRNELHLPGAESEAGGGSGGGVCALRMSRVFRMSEKMYQYKRRENYQFVKNII